MILILVLLAGTITNINAQKGPLITKQPVSVEFCLPDSRASVSFTVAASGTGLTYQWQGYNPKTRLWTDLIDIKGEIAGTKTTTLTIYKPLLGWSTGYSADVRVIVSAFLFGSTTSDIASLIINSPATITTDPVGNTIWIGETHTFSGTASGKPTPTYQWQRYYRLEWISLKGATSSTYATGTAGTYRLSVTNSCATDYSASATLTTVGITSQPGNVTVCSGYSSPVSFTIGASGATSYQWQVLELKLWIDIKYETSATYTITPGEKGFSTRDAGVFRCVVTFPLGTQNSNSAYFTVNTKPSITTHPVSQSVNEGESVTFNVAASSSLTKTYQWYKDDIAIEGATETSLTLNNLQSSDDGGYKCIVTNECGPTTSNTATLTVVQLAWPQGWFSQRENTAPMNSKYMNDVHAIDKNKAWIVVTEYWDSLLYTIDGGETWNWTHTGVANKSNWRTVFFTDSNHGWVGGYKTIAYTTDGGASWLQWYDAGANTFEDLYFIDSNTGWAVGYNGTIYMTSNGGVSWNPQSSGQTANFSQVHFADANNGVVVGQGGTILYTADGGSNWFTPTTNPANGGAALNAVYMVHADTAYIAGSYQSGTGYMHMKTTDGGITWTKLSGPNNYGWDLKFGNSKEGWMASNPLYGNGKIYYTNNGGQTWYEQATETNQVLYAISMVDADNGWDGWAVGSAGAMQRTALGGCRLPRVSLYADTTLCASLAGYLLRADTFGVSNTTFEWSTGETTDKIYANSPGGKYWVNVWNACGDKVTDTISVLFYPHPEAYAEAEDNAVCDSTPIQLEASGGVNYSWEPELYLSDPNIPNPIATPPMGETDFIVTVTDTNNCSNTDTVTINVPNYPWGEEICLVSVDLETGKNMVIWERQGIASIASYNIYRESTTADKYDIIGNVPFDDLSVFVDLTSQPEVKSHNYKISVVDTCGNESALSQYHKTMLLSSNLGANSINLSWSEYVVEGGGFGFVKYRIYRGDAPDNLVIIDSIASNNTGYNDIDPPEARMYYRIAGVKGDTCNPANLYVYGKKAGTGPYSHSMSNIEDNRLQVGINDLQDGRFNLKIYPNPFSQQTRITYRLDKPSDVKIEIYNLLGARTADIVNMKQDPGEFYYDLSAADIGVNQGVFYLRFTVDGITTVKKLILTR